MIRLEADTVGETVKTRSVYDGSPIQVKYETLSLVHELLASIKEQDAELAYDIADLIETYTRVGMWDRPIDKAVETMKERKNEN